MYGTRSTSAWNGVSVAGMGRGVRVIPDGGEVCFSVQVYEKQYNSEMDGSEIVSDILARSGMSKAALCRESGVSRSLLDAYLSGRSAPSSRQLERLARAAGCEIRVLITPRKPIHKAPESLVAVLELGELFPRKPAKPLPSMDHIWAAARERAVR